MKEKLSDFPFAENMNDICNDRVKNCRIEFSSKLLICKDCLCFNECKKRFAEVVKKVDLFSFER